MLSVQNSYMYCHCYPLTGQSIDGLCLVCPAMTTTIQVLFHALFFRTFLSTVTSEYVYVVVSKHALPFLFSALTLLFFVFFCLSKLSFSHFNYNGRPAVVASCLLACNFYILLPPQSIHTSSVHFSTKFLTTRSINITHNCLLVCEFVYVPVCWRRPWLSTSTARHVPTLGSPATCIPPTNIQAYVFLHKFVWVQIFLSFVDATLTRFPHYSW